MIKATIIMWIILLVVYIIFQILVSNLTSEEKFNAIMFKVYPARVMITGLLFFLNLIAAITMTIITVIKW